MWESSSQWMQVLKSPAGVKVAAAGAAALLWHWSKPTLNSTSVAGVELATAGPTALTLQQSHQLVHAAWAEGFAQGKSASTVRPPTLQHRTTNPNSLHREASFITHHRAHPLTRRWTSGLAASRWLKRRMQLAQRRSSYTCARPWKS